MRFPALAPRMSPLLPLCLALTLAGCSEERTPLEPAHTSDAAALTEAARPGIAACPPQDAQGRFKPALSNIWPNDDGRSWTYRIEERAWSDFLNARVYPTAAEVPSAPDLREVAELLRGHPIGANPQVLSAGYRLRFNGIKTTLSGAVGQNLETTILEEAAPAVAASSQSASAAAPAGFLRALSLARPDLTERIMARMPAMSRTESAPAAVAAVRSPNFLFGYAWEKTDEYIGSYGDLNTELAWKYLVADLGPGSSFTMQLVPDLADDVFLHAVVLGRHPSSGDDREFRRPLQVLYLVDFGVASATDVYGNVTGYYRVYSYGTVTYVPGVGPVASYERAFVSPGLPLDPGQYDQTIRLVATAPGSTSN